MISLGWSRWERGEYQLARKLTFRARRDKAIGQRNWFKRNCIIEYRGRALVNVIFRHGVKRGRAFLSKRKAGRFKFPRIRPLFTHATPLISTWRAQVPQETSRADRTRRWARQCHDNDKIKIPMALGVRRKLGSPANSASIVTHDEGAIVH